MRKNLMNIIQKIMELFYRSTITGFLSDTLGAKTEHKRDGNILIFNPEVIEKLSQTDKSKIIVKEIGIDIQSNDYKR